ncbi:hypothetical protein Tco_1068176, partial [Tanacetum coccineum]
LSLTDDQAPSLDGCTRCGIRGKQLKLVYASVTQSIEVLLDEERARNGRIYQDWYDLEAQEWAGPAEWRQYSYNPMNNWMTQQEDSTTANSYDPSQPSTSQGYMFHQLKGESSTPYESYHLDDL